jgi:hypothetical protein
MYNFYIAPNITAHHIATKNFATPHFNKSAKIAVHRIHHSVVTIANSPIFLYKSV